MEIKVEVLGREKKVDTTKGIDLSIPIRRGAPTVNCYGIPDPKIEPLQLGSFIGSTSEGGSVNCENVFFNPHGNGTHTECYGHISKPDKVFLSDCLKEFWFPAQVLEVEAKQAREDGIIGLDQVEGKLLDGVKALVCRTKNNANEDEQFNFTGTNPSYFSKEFVAHLVEQGIQHFLTDLPSIDREEDGGALSGHHIFWNYPNATRINSTITELVHVPETLEEGMYLLNLMVSNFETDASPSRPILYPLV